MATDPVCGMYVEPSPGALQLLRENRRYYFCSETCRSTFAEPERARSRMARRLLVAWPLALTVLVLTYGVRGGPAPYLAAVLAAVVQFYAGSEFYRGLYDGLRHHVDNLVVLIAVGTTTAFLYSLVVLVVPGRGAASPVYFDASALIVSLILTGNYLETWARERAGSALERIGELLPARVEVVRDGTTTTLRLEDLRLGEVVRVAPGARFPVDGVVRSGNTTADESLLTGEGIPLSKAPGDRVLAGSVNGLGVVDVEATRLGPDTFLAHIHHLLGDAERSRVPLQRTADRVAAAFAPAVLLLAFGAALAWYLFGGAGPTSAVLIFVSVAITACPCAFGIATPAAILVGSGKAAEGGILFRGEDAIERAARVDLVLTDKTGTLTTASPSVGSVRAAEGRSENEVLALAAGLEAGSEHVLARAVRAEASRRGISSAHVQDVRADPGRGVRGTLSGAPVAILRGDVARVEGVSLGPLEGAIRAADATGESWSVVVEGGTPSGIVSFRNRIAPGAERAVEELRADGIDVVMVTGDLRATAAAVARRLGISDVHAEVSPEEKVGLVGEYRRRGRCVAFVGDGLNDAAALAAGDIGVAIGSGTEVAREAGQVLLVRSSFEGVPVALGWARRIVGRVRANLAWATGYNVVLLPVAAGALVPIWGFSVYSVLPIVGACAMALSSTTVVVSSLALRSPASPASRARASGRAFPTQ